MKHAGAIKFDYVKILAIILHNIFMLKSHSFFKIIMAFKTLIAKSLSIQGNKKYTCICSKSKRKWSKLLGSDKT